MAFSRRVSGRSERRGPSAKEERSLFPIVSLALIAACVCLWVLGAKIYEDQMAVYERYTAIRQTVSQDTFFPGVSVDGVSLEGLTYEEARAQFAGRQQQAADAFSLVVESGEKRWRITSEEVPVFSNAQTVVARVCRWSDGYA